MAVRVPVIRRTVCLRRVGLQMDIHCVLHALCSECRPAVLNVAELLLLGGTVSLVLRDINNLAEGCGLANRSDLGRSLL